MKAPSKALVIRSTPFTVTVERPEAACDMTRYDITDMTMA